MTFEYLKKTGSFINEEGGTEDELETFEYEVSDKEIEEAMPYILYKKHFGTMSVDLALQEIILNSYKELVSDTDSLDSLEELYYKEIKEYFKSRALREENGI